jgi:hypothetical protein
MNLLDLKKAVDKALETEGAENLSVEVRVAGLGVGKSNTVKVKRGFAPMGWNTGKFMIETEELLRKTEMKK